MGYQSEINIAMGRVSMMRDFFDGLAHHGTIVGMRGATQWRTRMLPAEGAFEMHVRGGNEQMNLLSVPKTIVSSKAKIVE